MAARSNRPDDVNDYEQKRLDRIAANQAKLGKSLEDKPVSEGYLSREVYLYLH